MHSTNGTYLKTIGFQIGNMYRIMSPCIQCSNHLLIHIGKDNIVT